MRSFILILALLPMTLDANFMGLNSGARSLGMGNAYTALADDATGIFYNPAGLAMNNHFNFIISKQNLYGVDGLSSDMLSIAFPTSILRTGLAVQQIRLDDIYSEKIIYFTTAGIIRFMQLPVRFGMSFKNESVQVRKYSTSRSPSNYDIDAGILLEINKNLYFGYSSKFILEPKFMFVSQSDKLDRQDTFGINYKWRESVNFVADYILDQDHSSWNLGSEIWFYSVFSARVGMLDDKLTLGFGLKTDKWLLDVAMLAHTELGSTYRVSLGWILGLAK